MITLIVALKCEAIPLIEHFRLKHVRDSKVMPLYQNDDIRLVISGPGKVNSAAATAYCYSYSDSSSLSQQQFVWLNIGIAGHKDRPIGQGILVNKITDQSSQRSWYPPIVIDSKCEQEVLVTVDKAEADFNDDAVYEMEASGFYGIASRFSTSELVQCYKIISDNKKSTTSGVTEKTVKKLVENNVDEIESIIDKLDVVSQSLNQIQSIPSCYNDICDRHRFSVYQQGQLKTLLQRWSALQETQGQSESDLVSSLERCKNSSGVIQSLSSQLDEIRPEIVG